MSYKIKFSEEFKKSFHKLKKKDKVLFERIKKKLKEGNVLHIKYNKTNIEYILYINEKNGNNIKLTY